VGSRPTAATDSVRSASAAIDGRPTAATDSFRRGTVTVDTKALVLMTLHSSSDKSAGSVSQDLFPDEPVSNCTLKQRAAILSTVQLFSTKYREVLNGRGFQRQELIDLIGTLNAKDDFILFNLLSTFIIIIDFEEKGHALSYFVTKTKHWLIEAVQLTHNKYLQFNLGFYCEHGIGVDTDFSKAFTLYSSAANKHYARAVDRMRKLYLTSSRTGHIDIKYDKYASKLMVRAIEEYRQMKWANTWEKFVQHKSRISQELKRSTATAAAMKKNQTASTTNDDFCKGSIYNDDNNFINKVTKYNYPLNDGGIIPEQNNYSFNRNLQHIDASDHTEARGSNPSDKCITRKQHLQRTVNEFTNMNHLTLSRGGFTQNALADMLNDKAEGNNKDFYNLLCTFLAVEYTSNYRRIDADTYAERTATWLIEAVELTHNKYLQYNLGFYYEHGLGGVERDTSIARSLYSLSAKKRHAKASSRMETLDGYRDGMDSSCGPAFIAKSKSRKKIAGTTEEGQEQCKKCIYHPFATNHWTEDCYSKQENSTRKRKRASTASNED